MKVILLEDVKSLGKKGDIVDVSDGYAKNFLLTRKKGVEANSKNMNDLKLKKANDEKVAAQNLQDAKDTAEGLSDKTVVLKLKAGEGGKTFGSVSNKEIAEAAKEQFGLDIDKKKIVISEPIKSLGTYEVTVKLHASVTGKLKVKVEEA
ncbi:MAG: 50S ribosomal protein L9 [Lachnospiraceae bacterium]|nr:50S ribosomal protein L9 [Lachnospiraceae bacterium]MBR5766072.1 50S ribosomal protein L9 [Lachnospiraceae bacterium]MBR6469740.1 50S ribosomal protein L9 [Lachnospiraceae bacterium]MBR6486100.1 50S ribosomal protein L9 [Lachnospiraceae bacterium]